MKQVFVFAALLLTVFEAGAMDQPTITNVDGQVVEAVWPSGNRAQGFFYTPPRLRPPVEFEVTENLCNDAGIGQKFVVNSSVQLSTMGWRWVQHTDASKIGTVVDTGPDKFPLQDFLLVGTGSAFVDPTLGVGLEPDQIVFNEVNWIPGMQDGVLKDFDLDSWNAEGMRPNSQTGTDENRIVSGEISQKMVKVDAHTVTIVHSARGGFFESPSNSAAFMMGDVVSWSFLVKGQRCQIAFKPNLGPAQAQIQSLIANIKPEWAPYIWGQDSLLKVSGFPGLFTTGVLYANE